MKTWLRRSLPALVAGALIFTTAAIVGYFSESESAASTPLPVAAGSGGTRGSVQSFDGSTLRIVTDSGARDFTLVQNAPIERLAPASAPAPGSWLNAGAIGNDQNVFTIIGLTVIPQALLESR